ncbi:hypothetical protein JAAARDRAFT_485505 [Jaapia argillacea MUCL 33604]|uniref:Uncharacterized protein n=1 Tax=Jaapia argillacea MUCL 33604 TaxID=933084 RepID=A0A067PBR0_9AGAM|nr:hypothetical protein JAAARDRAFT_485505 [Jaapia argillacea MUCL 33604]
MAFVDALSIPSVWLAFSRSSLSDLRWFWRAGWCGSFKHTTETTSRAWKSKAGTCWLEKSLVLDRGSVGTWSTNSWMSLPC